MARARTEAADTFFERWRVGMAAFVAQGLGPGLFAAYGLFVVPLSEDFGVSHTSLAIGMSLFLVMQALLGPVLGPLLDRLPIRRIMLIGALTASIALFATSGAERPATLVACFVVAVVGINLYAPLPAIVLVTTHFDALRGRALAVGAVGTSVAGVLLPLGTAQLLEHFDWRVALACIASLVGGIALTAIAVCVPTTRASPAGRASTASKTIEPGLGDSGQQATEPSSRTSNWVFMRGRAFWIIGLTFSVLFALAGFYAFSIASHVREVGLSAKEAALVMSVGAFVSLCSKLVFATIADRIRERLIILTVGLIALQALAWVVILSAETLPFFLLGAGLYSVTIGPFLVLGPYLNSLYFDAEIIGRVNGSQAPLVLPFALSAPPLAGLSYDLTGSYVPAFQAAIVVLGVLGTLFLFLGAPRRATSNAPTKGTRHAES
jgi:MFS family permease